MAEGKRKYDLVIFGATGYTGQHVVEEVARVINEDEKQLTWAIAGRSQEKLKTSLQTAEKITGLKLQNTPIIIANINDDKSLASMAKQAKVVLNCVGPYRLWGEQVVKACVENGASHVDITGESQYIDNMRLKYNELAEKKKVFVVSACGFDCVPSDMGVVHLGNQFKGDLNSAEIYLEVPAVKAVGPSIHYGTWHSLIYHFANFGELKELTKKLTDTSIPKPEYKLQKRGLFHYSDVVKGWCLEFLAADRSVATHSQNILYKKYGKRPVQVEMYVKIGTIFHILALMLWGGFIGLLSKFSFTRNWLLEYPGLFTLGKVTKSDIPRENNKLSRFRTTIVGNGWSESLSEGTDRHKEPPNKKMSVRIEGTDPGYVMTAAMLVLSALTILKESDKIPSDGGVLSTGGAFAKTSFLEKMTKRGYPYRNLE